MVLFNKQLDEIIFDKQVLTIKYDKKIIDEETYVKKIKELKIKEVQLRKKLIDEFKENQIKEGVKEKMEEPKVVEEVKKKIKQPKKDSYTTLIIDSLMKKSVKNVEDVVTRVDEKKPGRDKSKIMQQTKMIIYLVKKQKAERWTKYAWDEENFLLTLKE